MSEQTDAALRAEIADRGNEINILKEQLATAKQTVKDIRENLRAVELRAARDGLLLKILNGEKLKNGGGRKPKAAEAVTGEDVVTDEQEAVAA